MSDYFESYSIDEFLNRKEKDIYLKDTEKEDKEPPFSIIETISKINYMKIENNLNEYLNKEENEKYFISFFVYKENIKTKEKVLMNICTTKNILEIIENLYNSFSIMPERKRNLYILSLKEEYPIGIDEIEIYKNLEKEILDLKPCSFYQTSGESLYKIKYKSNYNIGLEKAKKDLIYKKEENKFEIKKEIKNKKSINKKEYLKNEIDNESSKKQRDSKSRENQRIAKNIDKIVSEKQKEESSITLKIIEENKEKIKYVARSEDEIYEWSKNYKKRLLVSYISLGKEALRLK